MRRLRKALVTGGSRGIGAAITKALARDGYEVIINYNRDYERAESVRADIANSGGRAQLAKFSVENDSEIKIGLTRLGISELDLLVNNAGILRDNLVISNPIADWKSVVHTNFLGAVFSYNNCRSLLLNTDRPRVINIASISGFMGGKGQASYATSKSMLLEWNRQMSKSQDGAHIAFTAVSPGPVATDLVMQAPFYKDPNSQKMIPMRKFGSPGEIGELVSFIAQQPGKFLSGYNWIVDGGFTLSSKS